VASDLKVTAVSAGDPLSTSSSARRADPFARIALLVLVVLAAAGGSGLQHELRFFSPASINASTTSPPVPQYNPGAPAVNAAIRLAAGKLPASAVCVIDKDAWTDDFQRASFLLLPRRVWPYSEASTQRSPTAFDLAAALSLHHAGCLLADRPTAVPAGYTRLTRGAYSLYVAAGRSER
jgi:hypothetical protein